MKQIQIRLDQEIVESMKEVEISISEWSIRHTNFSIQADAAKTTVQTLMSSRQNTIQKILKESGIDSTRLKSINISDDNIMTVLIAAEDSPDTQDSSTPAS